MDVRAQLSQLDETARDAIARRIKARLAARDDDTSDHHVAIIGGGVAALTLALELRSARPGTRVLVVEPTPHPVPEITHTVGESTVEISAHYLRDRLGLADHLLNHQIRKMGLRMFSSQDDNTDISRRVEVGSSAFVPQTTYQIDRGRLENELHRRCLTAGVEFATGRVRAVALGDDATPHRVTIQRDDDIERTPAGSSTRPAAIGCCRASSTSSAPTDITATPPGCVSPPRSMSASGVTTPPGMPA